MYVVSKFIYSSVELGYLGVRWGLLDGSDMVYFSAIIFVVARCICEITHYPGFDNEVVIKPKYLNEIEADMLVGIIV